VAAVIALRRARPATTAPVPPTDEVRAWDLTEGDKLPDGHLIVSLDRNARDRTVRIATTEPASTVLGTDDPVPVVRR
jgi:hypothetical protein